MNQIDCFEKKQSLIGCRIVDCFREKIMNLAINRIKNLDLKSFG